MPQAQGDGKGVWGCCRAKTGISSKEAPLVAWAPRAGRGISLPNACLLEEVIPGHVEIRAFPLSLGEEEEAVRAVGAPEKDWGL